MPTLAPYGFQTSQSRRSTNEYYVPASDTATYAIGDPVKTSGNVFTGRLPDSRVSAGMLHVTKASPGDSIRGVVVGLLPDPNNAGLQSLPATKQRAYTLLVNDDPQAVWDVQADNTSLLSAMAGMYASYTVGSPTGSVSSTKLNSSTLGSTVRDLLVVEVLDNRSVNALMRVKFVQHELAAAGASPQISAAVQALVLGAGTAPQRMVGENLDQPAGITKAVTKFGKLAARFGTGQWTASSGSPTLTQGYTGWDGSGAKTGIVSRTGQPDMLKVVPAANTTEVISLGTFATNMLTKNLGGKFGLWVYVENKPGYDTGSAGAGSIGFEMGTNADNSNPLVVTFTGNQVREGWNFLTFVMRDPTAYADGSGAVEYHPYGIVAGNFGTGANSNIKDNAIAYLRISWDNLSGATLYFDSLWTGFETKAQVVLGCDSGINLETIAGPIFDSYGWVGYLAMPYRIYSSGSYQVIDMDGTDGTDVAQVLRMYAKGWEWWNHTVNHLANAALTSEAAIAYELQTAQAWQYENDMPRGAEFYASPQSSTSRLSEKVIKGLGFKLQRHARHWNVTPTPFGIDNPHHVGALDISSAGGGALAYGVTTSGTGSSVTGLQTATKIKRCVDIAVAYGATIFPFWHGITTSGDTGSGEDLTGSDLLITSSAFTQAMAYIRQLEQAGALTVCKGGAGFYYGA